MCTIIQFQKSLAALVALGHGKDAGPGHLNDTDRLESVEEDGDPLGNIAHLDHHLGARHVDDPRSQDLAVVHDIPAVSAVVFDLDQQKLAVDALRFIKSLDLDDVQLFIELFFNLLECALITGADDDHAGNFLVIRLADSDGVDIETAPPEKPRSLTQDTGAVLDQNGIYSFHSKANLHS